MIWLCRPHGNDEDQDEDEDEHGSDGVHDDASASDDSDDTGLASIPERNPDIDSPTFQRTPTTLAKASINHAA